jgi:uncharacterized tellurite resistance protein B-like protein
MAAIDSPQGHQPEPDELLAALLAAGKTVADAAQSVGMSERTAFRRLSDSDFRRRVSAVRGQMVDAVVGRLVNASTKAVETLASLLGAESESVRLSAAKAIVELSCRLREAGELEERVLTLEQRPNGAETTHTSFGSSRARTNGGLAD